jgi:hypothetical protein
VRNWPCQTITTTASGPPSYPEPWPFACPHSIRGIRGQLTGAPPDFTAPPGAWGCWRSHLRLWEDMLNHPHPGLVIFEQDVIFRDWHGIHDFLAAVPPDWDLIYLGGQHLAPRLPVSLPSPSVLSSPVCRGANINRTHAYLVRNTPRTQAAYWRLATMQAEPRCRQHLDYILGGLIQRGQLTAYCPARWFCGQAGGISTITGKTYPDRWWD